MMLPKEYVDSFFHWVTECYGCEVSYVGKESKKELGRFLLDGSLVWVEYPYSESALTVKVRSSDAERLEAVEKEFVLMIQELNREN